MKRVSLVRTWAAFGVFWIVTFAILIFARQDPTLVAVIVLLSFYVGIIIALVSVVQILYNLLKRSRGTESQPASQGPF